MIQPVSFNGIIRSNLHKLKNRKHQTNAPSNAENNNDKRLIKNKTARIAAIGLGSLIGAAILAMTGLYLYKKPTKADKELIKLLEEKFAPVKNAIQEAKEQEAKHKKIFIEKAEEFTTPLAQDAAKASKIPEIVNKENLEQTQTLLKELEQTKIIRNNVDSKNNIISEINDTYLNVLKEKYNNVVTKCKAFLEEIKPEKLPRSRHSKSIISESKYLADKDIQAYERKHSWADMRMQRLTQDYQTAVVNCQNYIINKINNALEQILSLL